MVIAWFSFIQFGIPMNCALYGSCMLYATIFNLNVKSRSIIFDINAEVDVVEGWKEQTMWKVYTNYSNNNAQCIMFWIVLGNWTMVLLTRRIMALPLVRSLLGLDAGLKTIGVQNIVFFNLNQLLIKKLDRILILNLKIFD